MKLKILTWNIAALPRLINLFGNPSDRINGIIKYLKEVDADIICLQEVFDNKILEKIVTQMKSYVISYPKKKGKGFISSGLIVLTKMPILSSQFEIFTDSIGENSYAEKGVLVSQIARGDFSQKIFLLNTHLNANPMFTLSTLSPNVIRKSQLLTLAKLLKNKSDFYIICGDLNQSEKSDNFKTFVESIQKKFHMKVFTKTERDYIILCFNDKVSVKHLREKTPKHKKLSDHDPIIETIEINTN